MAKTVKLTEELTYRMDKSRTRTLPAGWRGEVSDELAAMVEEEGKGEIFSEVAAEEGAEKKAAKPRQKSAAKKPAAKKPAAPKEPPAQKVEDPAANGSQSEPGTGSEEGSSAADAGGAAAQGKLGGDDGAGEE